MNKRATDINYTGGSIEAGSSRQLCQQTLETHRSVKIHAALFFDGTLNNRTNSRLGEQGLDKGSSYRQPPSNIAILEEHHQSSGEYDLSFSLYIEGIGTKDEETDTIIAAGLGIGATGIIDKVDRAIERITTKIVTKVPCDEQIDHVHLDCFGFSRGAAAARTFIHETLEDKKKSLKLRLERTGRTVHEVKVRFVGLYDTVAAYGVDQDNDTAAIHLDAIRQAE